MMTNLKILLAFAIGLVTMYFMRTPQIKEVTKIEYVDRVVEKVVNRTVTQTKKATGEVQIVTIETEKENTQEKISQKTVEKDLKDKYAIGITASKQAVLQARLGDLPLWIHGSTDLKQTNIGVLYTW